MMKRVLEYLKAFLGFLKRALLILITLGLLFFFLFAARIVDKSKNIKLLSADDPLAISEKARQLHNQLTIADWHADNLLWDRDPLERIDHGHVDIPRLIAGGFYLQVFSAVIKTPRGLNYHSNVGRSDNITFLAMANRWPVASWFSLSNRALHQANVLREASNKSSQLTLIETSDDLSIFLKLRKSNTNMVAGLLSIEGMYALEGDVDNIDRFFKAGYRVMGLVHFFDNQLGGSSAGVEKGGLTAFGKLAVQKMNEMNIIIDLSHASEQLFEETIRFSTRPVVVTHTGAKGTFDSPRNLSDQQLRMIASHGGIVGIGFWEGATGDTSIESIVAAIRHTVDVVGIDHVCLGSDFDGATTILFDASQVILLTDGLIRAGFSDEDIQKVMGGNQIRFLLENLPAERTSY